jgi:hypothetical protein
MAMTPRADRSKGLRHARPLVVLLVLGCTPPRAAPVTSPSSATIEPPAATALRVETTAAPSSPPPRPSRRGQCRLDAALADFLGADSAIRCGDILPRASVGDYETVRACIVAAVGARRAFSATFTLSGLDSSFQEAYAGRNTGSGYEVRSFSYDSCPSGCGDEDPAWWSRTCRPLVDLRSACPVRKHGASDEGLRWACDEVQSVARDHIFSDPRKQTRRRLELWCDQPADAGTCP